MHVRQYEDRSDARAIARIQARAWTNAYADLRPADVLASQSTDPDDETIAGWHRLLETNRRGVLLAADEAGNRLGFADVRWGDAETKAFVGENGAGLKSIYVDPDSWDRE